MKIALLAHRNTPIDTAIEKYNPTLIIQSNHKNWLADAGLQLEERIYLDGNVVDLAVILVDQTGEITAVDDTVRFWGDSFYCRPHVLVTVCSSYKMPNWSLKSLLTRLGYSYVV